MLSYLFNYQRALTSLYLEPQRDTEYKGLNKSVNLNDIQFFRSFIGKLPDKGAKISKFRSQLGEELLHRDEVEKTCGLFSGLNIGKGSVSDEIEWTGKYSHTPHEIQLLDSDDESDEDRNSLKILATQSGVGTYKKTHKIEEPEESLIKPEDLKDSGCCSTSRIEGSEPEEDAYVKLLCNKLEKQRENRKEQFRPYRIPKPSGQSADTKQSKKPLGPHWEVTAATPPPPIHGDVKLISLQESLLLQKEQAAKLKVLVIFHANLWTKYFSE